MAKKCCICGKNIDSDYDCNNPYPVMPANRECCSDCNQKYVVPARLVLSYPMGYDNNAVIFLKTPTKKELEALTQALDDCFAAHK